MEEAALLPYLAGFVDGEGSISVNEIVTDRKRQWTLRLTVHQVNPAPLLLLQQRFGGRIRRTGRIGAQRPIYEWGVFSRMAEQAIRELRPYLVVKADEADVALSFQALMKPRSERRIKLTGEEVSERQVHKAELERLKRREYALSPPKTA